MLKTKLFIFKEIIFIVLGHFPCLLLLDLPVDINSEHIVCCAVGWAVSCAQEVSKGAFFSAHWAEHFGVSCDAVWGSYLFWMVGLNGEAEQSNILAILHILNIDMGLILVPINSSHCADHFNTWLIFLQPTVLLWMVGLHGGAEQSNVLAILHVLNVHMELILVPIIEFDWCDSWPLERRELGYIPVACLLLVAGSIHLSGIICTSHSFKNKFN